MPTPPSTTSVTLAAPATSPVAWVGREDDPGGGGGKGLERNSGRYQRPSEASHHCDSD